MRRTILLAILTAALILNLAACNMPSGTPDAAATLKAVYTAQAITRQPPQPTANGGQGQNNGGVQPPPTLSFPTLPANSATPQIATPTPSNTPVRYTATPLVYCDWASFVTDITYADGSSVAPGAQFTKIWRLKNIGTCTWTTAYSLVFVRGDNMQGSAAANLPVNVAPGQSMDVSVNLTAPNSMSEYRGYWTLRNAAGQTFGVGGAAADPFWVDVVVSGPMSVVYDLAAKYCSASWSSDAGDLGCPGDLNSNDGNANKVQNPKLENGHIFEGLGLLTVPQNIKNGYIKGLYPAFPIQSGDHFRALINCAYQSTGCNVIFQFNYQSSGVITTLWQYNEAYDGQYDTVDVDLSALDGKSVKFILETLTNGSPKNDQPLWINPRIERLNSLITPTVTPTATATVTRTPTLTPHP